MINNAFHFGRNFALFVSLMAAMLTWAGKPVNVNEADAKVLADSLDGIGLKKAEAVVKYREEHGNFKAIKDLVNVKGIGEKTLAKNAEFIQL
ncbi:putative protein [BD1-7 clade bacterium]|uniref:Helix-hairpin-helix DNA-binding motif class 1 domain-containing protein n=1 Tax=BD1-7 clade bacterium TaxID=2029982 RepID=A0A5S9Q8A3_9GAMM|nr:putative protein [BD1-7 clade bacterium]CAA0114383.1 putative protein [BD1-7 clade bacterium]